MVRAKFKVRSVTNEDSGLPDKPNVIVALHPVYGDSEENKKFFQSTPGGEIKLCVVSPETAQKFKVGAEYYVDFTEAN